MKLRKQINNKNSCPNKLNELNLANARSGWCHKYALYEIKPIDTNALDPRNLPVIVFWFAKQIINKVPMIGIKAYKPGNGVWELYTRIEKKIRNKPIESSWKLLMREIKLKFCIYIANKDPDRSSQERIGVK